MKNIPRIAKRIIIGYSNFEILLSKINFFDVNNIIIDDTAINIFTKFDSGSEMKLSKKISNF